MIRRLRFVVIAVYYGGMFFSCSTFDTGTSADVAPPPVPQIIHVKAGETETIAYVGASLPPAGTTLGYHYDGLMQVRQWSNTLTPNLVETWRGWLLSRGQELLKGTGYSVVDTNSAFGRYQDTSDAAFALAGTITYLSLNSYAPLAGNFTRAGMTVRWELFDVNLKKVVYSLDTNGEARIGGVSGGSVVSAFNTCLERLLADKAFVGNVLKSKNATTTQTGNWRAPLPDQSQIITISEPKTSIGADWIRVISQESVLLLSGNKGSGTAFVISSSGYILTNYHVIEGQSRITAKFPNGETAGVRIVRTSPPDDVALLQVDVTGKTAIPVDSSGSYGPGDEVIAIGNPLDQSLSFSITKGIVSGVRFAAGKTVIQTDVAVNIGNSGGPLVNFKSGLVIGIVSSKLVGPGVEGIAFAIDIRDALRVLGVRVQ